MANQNRAMDAGWSRSGRREEVGVIVKVMAASLIMGNGLDSKLLWILYRQRRIAKKN